MNKFVINYEFRHWWKLEKNALKALFLHDAGSFNDEKKTNINVDSNPNGFFQKPKTFRIFKSSIRKR